MANVKITELTEDTAPTTDDVLAIVNEPGGTPVTKKTTLANLLTAALYAIRALSPAASRIPYYTGSAAAGLLTLDTDGTLAGNSDTAVATQKAGKTYADTKIAKATNVTAITDTGIADGEIAVFNLSNKDIRTSNVLISTDGTLAGNADTNVPTEKAVKTYADGRVAKTTNITALNETGIADGEIAVFNLSNKDIRTSNVLISTDGTLAGNADTNVPTEKAVKTYADKMVTKALFDANSILAATSDDTPAAVTIGEQTMVGRITGGAIAALTPAQILAGFVYERENVVEDLSYLPPVTATWDPAELADGVGETSAAIAYPGVALGLFTIEAIAPYDLQGITLNAYVDAANSIKARLQNETAGTINLASGTWTFQARRV